MIKETKTNRDFQPRTIETARWAREQVKRQLGGSQGVIAQSWAGPSALGDEPLITTKLQLFHASQ